MDFPGIKIRTVDYEKKRKNIENMTYLCIQFVSLKFTPKLTCFFFLFLSSRENSYKFIYYFFSQHYKVVPVATE